MNDYISFQNMQYCDYFQLQPAGVKGPQNPLVAMERRYLLNKLFSVYKFTLPKSWPLAYFRYWLFLYGSIGVFYTHDSGWIMSDYGVSKMGMYYLPAVITSFSPWLNRQLDGLIGVNASIIHIMDDRQGLDDLITEYAVQLAEIDKQIKINLMTCGTGYVYWTDSKKEGDDIKAAWTRQSMGEPLVICGARNKSAVDKKPGIQQFNPDVSKNYITDKLLSSRRTLVNNFLTEVGIRNTNYEKKERLTNMEIQENNDETSALSDIILETLRDDFDKLNAISDLDLAVELRRERSGNDNIMGNVSMGQYNTK